MANVSRNTFYDEIKVVKSKIGRLEGILIPEEELSDKELKELDKLREEAIATLKKGIYNLPKGYKFKREEAYEDRIRKIIGSH